jgi:hypothetical protein
MNDSNIEEGSGTVSTGGSTGGSPMLGGVHRTLIDTRG